MKILVVCLGNICRSPLAHGIFAHEISKQNLPWEIDSAGTGDYHVGKAPDPRSIQEAKSNGLDISKQGARQLKTTDFHTYDHILVMDAMNYQNARSIAPTEQLREKVELIMNYADPGRNGQVPDPYWDDNGFANVYNMLVRAVDGFIQQHTESNESA
ncbi:MAG: low molecular weight protein-tyrosine-phosphatase [Saprospiraceae bacterium]